MVRIVVALFLRLIMIGGGKPCGACCVRWWVEVFSQPLIFRIVPHICDERTLWGVF